MKRSWINWPGCWPSPPKAELQRSTGEPTGFDPTLYARFPTKEDRPEGELEELELAQGRFSVQEERRLAYVAYTRARHRMLLTAPIWSTGTRPRVTSRFLEDVRMLLGVRARTWLEMPDPDDPAQMSNPRLAEQLTATWPVERDERRRAVLDVSTALLSAREASSQGVLPMQMDEDRWGELVELLLAERAERSRHLDGTVVPEHLSTSALVELASDPDGFRRRLRRPLPTPPASQARVGTAFHAWVEQHYAAATLVDLHDLELDDTTEPADLEHLRVVDGHLELDATTGDIYGTDNGEPSNFVLQQLDGDWTVETLVDGSTLTRQYEQGGLMVYVDDDNYVKLDISARNNPGSTLELVPGAGHLIQLDAPAALATILHRWLSSADPPGATGRPGAARRRQRCRLPDRCGCRFPGSGRRSSSGTRSSRTARSARSRPRAGRTPRPRSRG